MFNTIIKLIAFPALCLMVAFGGASNAQDMHIGSGIIAPEGEDAEVVVPEGAIEWGAFGADAAPAFWTMTPILVSSGPLMTTVAIEVRDGDACRRAAEAWLQRYDATGIRAAACTSFDGEFKIYEK